MKIGKILLLIFILFIIGSCSGKNTEKIGEKKKVSFILDWIPNTNHTGIYVAKEKGFYDEVGIDIDIINPPEESVTALVAANRGNFGITVQENIGMALDKNENFPIVAVASLIQHNTSGLISLKDRGIKSFKDLEGKRYATWGNEIEQAIISQVMENEKADFKNVKLYYSTVTDVLSAIQREVDAIWVYEAWDVIMAKYKGLDYNFIKFSDVEPALDYYTPVLVSNNSFLTENKEVAKKFLEATKKGYEYAIANPEESAKILHKYSPEYDLNMLIESQKFLAKEYKADIDRWGYISPERWNRFFSWAKEKKLINKDLKDKGFSNEYLSQ